MSWCCLRNVEVVADEGVGLRAAFLALASDHHVGRDRVCVSEGIDEEGDHRWRSFCF